MKLTTRSGIICPNCNQEVGLETEGFLGGIIKQLFLHACIGQATAMGTVRGKCDKCDQPFEIKNK